MNTNSTISGERLAGLLGDLALKIQRGRITLDELELFLKRKNPFERIVEFNRNEHGHFVVSLIGLNLTGAQEIAYFKEGGYRITAPATSVLMESGNDVYDKNHRLITGKTYRVVLMPGTVFGDDLEHSTENLDKKASEFGYQKPLAGIMPRVRQIISDEAMERMGFWFIMGLHEPLHGKDGEPSALISGRSGSGCYLGVLKHTPESRWSSTGAFAYIVPEPKRSKST